ncbi:MAG: cytochrome C biogenesis protein [bacterium]|nr:cytochrome C biogenesis protein [bacterium]
METFSNNIGLYLDTSILLSFAAAFTGGLLTSFTPCVYPLIPITSGFVTSKNLETGTKWNAFFLSVLYVLGVSVVYAGLGVFAAQTGKLFGQLSTNPVSYFIVGNIMIILSLSMFDVFYLQFRLPSFLQRSKQKENRKGFLGVFLIGMASGLVVAPCTAPSLGMLLAYVSTTQNLLMGALLLFVFSLGMGTLLVVVGTFSGALSVLPKSGQWMVRIKKGMAVVMILMGEYFIFKAGQLWI